jgi:hypothetical protein
MATAAVVLPAILIGIWRHRQIAGPKGVEAPAPLREEREPKQAAAANLASEG